MKSERIFDAITEINEEYIEEAKAEEVKRKKKPFWKIAGMAAAFFIGVVALGIIGRILLPGASAGGGTNREPGSDYMSYSGPAFPLTALEDTSGLEFERNVDFDFSPYYNHQESYENSKGEMVYYDSWDNDAVIRDNYTVTNTTDEDITFTAVYPFAGNFRTALSRIPKITVDGKTVETELKIGPYSGGFAPAWGDEGGSESLNLSSLESWDEYKILLESGEYLKDALAENPSLDQEVIVYSFGIDYNIPMEEFDQIENADLLIDVNFNEEKSGVLNYGFNGMFRNEEGRKTFNTHIPKSFSPDFGKQKIYLIVTGEDIEIAEAKAVAGMGDYEKRPETDAVTVTMERFETTFGELMFNMVDYSDEMIKYGSQEEATIRDLVSSEEYVGYVAEFLYAHGQLSENPAERYSFGRLDDVISEVGHVSRVMYVTFEVTVPAGETLEIGTSTIREASYDFFGSREKMDLEGFDMVTRLGTNLNIIKQTASVSNTEEIEIVYNNFGFDLQSGITSVLLGDEEHYWMEIAKIRSGEN
ncbi:MAG: hypothetical protein IJA17_04025 [Oscillospiraceae bacterium]|nr:hypothetical protein [Oscillospiraceae bacterium]